MLHAFHTTLALLALGLAPLLWVVSIAYVRRFEGVQLSWKQTPLVYVTLGCFVLMLTAFLLGCFFGAAYLGRLNGIRLVQVDPTLLGLLTLDCAFVMLLTAFVYLAFRNFFTQFITREGIYLLRWPQLLWLRSLDEALLPWASVRDYYQHSDYPITRYRLMTQNAEGRIERHELQVPFYVLPRFEALLEMTLMKQEELREQQRQRQRKPSGQGQRGL